MHNHAGGSGLSTKTLKEMAKWELMVNFAAQQRDKISFS
jgi:hypothetical protein